MASRGVRAPVEDGGILLDPGWSGLPALVHRNRELFHTWSHDFQGRSAQSLRALARDELATFWGRPGVSCGCRDMAGERRDAVPLIVTGHQPEPFHPGVWAKNVMTSRLAGMLRGTGLNLIIDNDVPHRPGFLVPTRERGSLRSTLVSYDRAGGEVPYEDYRVKDRAWFESLPQRIREQGAALPGDTMLDQAWDLVVAGLNRPGAGKVGEAFSHARQAVEGHWGVANREAWLSRLCETASFGWFASHLMAHADRFREVHNAALAQYRRGHRIRSRHHPVPELARQGEWVEVPFWAWRRAQPRRRQLLVRSGKDGIDLRMEGEDAPFLSLPLGPDRDAAQAVERLAQLPALGIRLRTRALTTTLFARLIVADLFIHGIGGAKYDELGDAIMRRFFGVEPPGFVTLSMTLHLGIPQRGGDEQEIRQVESQLRRLRFQPEQAMNDAQRAHWAAWIERKQSALGAATASRRERVARFQEIALCNRHLERAVQGRRSELEGDCRRIETWIQHDQVARGREYPWLLHSEKRLWEAFQGLAAGAAGVARSLAVDPVLAAGYGQASSDHLE